jgi:hypothetical protein
LSRCRSLTAVITAEVVQGSSPRPSRPSTPSPVEDWTTDLHEVLFDLGYEGLGNSAGLPTIAYKKPKGATLTDEQKAHNRIHNGNVLRAVGKRANALLKAIFRLLRNITIDPWKIGLVAKATLVILHTEYRRTA